MSSIASLVDPANKREATHTDSRRLDISMFHTFSGLRCRVRKPRASERHRPRRHHPRQHLHREPPRPHRRTDVFPARSISLTHRGDASSEMMLMPPRWKLEVLARPLRLEVFDLYGNYRGSLTEAM